jgi:radical SAM-linked protein
MVRQRVRIRFCKQGNLRLIGHRDLVRTMERVFRRAGLRLGMSQGFHPKPRMSFPSALAVGIEGLDEVMELELAEPCTSEELLARLSANSLPGLVFESVEILPAGVGKARIKSATYQVRIPPHRVPATTCRIARLLAESSHPIQRPHKNTTVDIRQTLQDLTVTDGVLRMRLGNSRQASASARDVLGALDLEDLQEDGMYLARTTVELES